MAVKLTGTELLAELNLLTNNKFNRVSNERFVRYLNRALLNRYSEMVEFVNDEYSKTVLLTFTARAFEIALPLDMNKDEITASFLVYQDTELTSLVSHAWIHEISILKGKLQFRYEQEIGTEYTLVYTKDPGRYTDITDEVDETSSIRALEILTTEIESIHDSDKYQGQMPAQYQAAQIKTNNIS